ncbi:MAG: carboxymuconolactone decarboxylase family protein [Marmoricola sp.]
MSEANVTKPRIAPGGFRETGPAIWAFSRIAGVVTGTKPPHVFTTRGRNRGLFWGWLHFAGKLMPGGTLPRHESEMVILRVAHLRGCAYEFEHHRRLGGRAGLTAEQIEALTGDLDQGPWSERELTLLRTADALIAQKDLDDAQWARLTAELSEKSALELVMLVGHYDMLATALITLRVQPDKASRLSRARRLRKSR